MGIQSSGLELELRCARQVAILRVSRLMAVRNGVDLAIAVAGVAGVVLQLEGQFVGISAAAWMLLRVFLVGRVARASLRTSARLQEMFDCRLFGLPWNGAVAGEPLDEHRIRALSIHVASRIRREQETGDWYATGDDRTPRAALSAQRQSATYF